MLLFDLYADNIKLLRNKLLYFLITFDYLKGGDNMLDTQVVENKDVEETKPEVVYIIPGDNICARCD